MTEQFDVYCGLDVGKSDHHATALTPAGERVFDKPLPQDKARLRELFTDLGRRRRVLWSWTSPIPLTRCRSRWLATADARDAFIIFDTVRTMLHTLWAVDRDSEVVAALKVLSGFDADLTHESTRAINRLRSLLLQIFPSLERVFVGTIFTRTLVLELLTGGPAGLRAAGRRDVLRWARNHSRKDPATLIDEIFTTLTEQTVTVIGTEAVELMVPRVAGQVKELKQRRAVVAAEVEKLLDDFPLPIVLMSMPGVGILTVGDASSFASAGHLAAYAGIAPVTRRSGISIPRRIPRPLSRGNCPVAAGVHFTAGHW